MLRIFLLVIISCSVHSLDLYARNEIRSGNGHNNGGQGGGKIHDGTPATEGEFPYHIALLQDGEYSCGGSIIDDKWILTAAHCVTASIKNGGSETHPGVPARYFQVVYGSLFLDNKQNRVQVTYVHVHPNWIRNDKDHQNMTFHY